jgi:hypothetical protein
MIENLATQRKIVNRVSRNLVDHEGKKGNQPGKILAIKIEPSLTAKGVTILF